MTPNGVFPDPNSSSPAVDCLDGGAYPMDMQPILIVDFLCGKRGDGMRYAHGSYIDGVHWYPYFGRCDVCGAGISAADRRWTAPIPDDHPEHAASVDRFPDWCGHAKGPGRTFCCSLACDRRAKRRIEAGHPIAIGERMATCAQCDKPFTRSRSTQALCSKRCRSRARYLKSHTDARRGPKRKVKPTSKA